MSKNNHPLIQFLKKNAKKQLKLDVTFKKASCHGLICAWNSDQLLNITPTPYLYIPDYDYSCRNYEDDSINFSKIIKFSDKESDFLFYKCREGDSKFINMLVIFPASKYDIFYKNLKKLDKLKAFL